ncbi:sulfate ABC transporter permease subunit CysT [bacterium]|nr:sulfate ABC transporter permease subunit CysT [bacterium]
MVDSLTNFLKVKNNRRFRLPGFGLSTGITLTYLSVLVLIPLVALVVTASTITRHELVTILTNPRVIAAFKVTFSTAIVAAVINGIFGTLVAWVHARYSYPGKRLLDALIDLPFALPTAVAGIALTALFASNGWVGQFLVPLGINLNYSWWGITIALVFVGMPFVIRTVEPVLDDFDKELEEAARTLGATPWQTFVKVIFPLLLPAVLTGTTLAFARCLGEYGSVVFISGNMPMKTEIVPLLIITKLEQYDYVGATVIATTMLVLSFGLLLIVNLIQWIQRRRLGMES